MHIIFFPCKGGKVAVRFLFTCMFAPFYFRQQYSKVPISCNSFLIISGSNLMASWSAWNSCTVCVSVLPFEKLGKNWPYVGRADCVLASPPRTLRILGAGGPSRGALVLSVMGQGGSTVPRLVGSCICVEI